MSAIVELDVELSGPGIEGLVDDITDKSAVQALVGILAGEDPEILERAVKHEFGDRAGGIPERSFIRGTMDKDHKEIVKDGDQFAEAMLLGKMTKRLALEAWGDKLTVKMKEGITTKSLDLAENAQSTIDQKGSDTPLIDTGQMVNSINYEVTR